MITSTRAGAVAMLLVLSALVVWPPPAQAHRDGCHRWHSCPSDTGSYVCGDLGYFSECGYTSIPEEPATPVYDTDPPRRPVVSAPKTRPKGVVAVTVSAESGADLEVRSGGKTVHRATATGGSQVLSFKGLEGTRAYAVRATDSSGNTSAVAKFKATADGVAPSLDGTEVTPGTARNANAELSFAAGEPARYVVTLDGRRVAAGRVTGDDAVVALPVGNGRHRLVVTLKDAAKNVSTFKQALRIDIPELAPTLEAASEHNESTQRFRFAGTPGSSGTLSIAGRTLPVRFESDTAEVAVDLPDGDYADGVLEVRDRFGRTGSVVVPGFGVDTTDPVLELDRRTGRSTTGRLVALITAEKGARVAWRVVDGAGHRVAHSSYVSTGRARTVDVDADEGDVVLEVEATDEAGNARADSLEATIGADPVTAADWLILLMALALVIGGAALAWARREAIRAWRERRRHARQVRAARTAYDLALRQHAQQLQQHAAVVGDYQHGLRVWLDRQQYLTRLHEEAQTTQGSRIDDAKLLGAKVKKGEVLFALVGGSLVERRTRRNIPTLVEAERGQVAITNLRVLFQGRFKKREWDYAKLERVTEPSADISLLEVENRKSLSGVRYDDPERTRLMLAVALAPETGERQQAVRGIASLLSGHAAARPVEPPPPPPAPEPPAILLEASAVPVS